MPFSKVCQQDLVLREEDTSYRSCPPLSDGVSYLEFWLLRHEVPCTAGARHLSSTSSSAAARLVVNRYAFLRSSMPCCSPLSKNGADASPSRPHHARRRAPDQLKCLGVIYNKVKLSTASFGIDGNKPSYYRDKYASYYHDQGLIAGSAE